MQRSQLLNDAQLTRRFDVVILGGGINGACLFDTLVRNGYSVLLVEKGDFSSGTSQSSGMMIWGGLLYLRNLELTTAFRFSRDRDRILREKRKWATPARMRYLVSHKRGRAQWWVQTGLWLYWLMSRQRGKPSEETHFSEMQIISEDVAKTSLTYEEGTVESSDTRFVLRWILPHLGNAQIALNYCTVTTEYDENRQQWGVTLTDLLGGAQIPLYAGMIVNCCGIWADSVNGRNHFDTPYRHALSKGVYLGIRRPVSHTSTLIFELNEHSDVITLVPWGPISLWGPTETAVHSIDEGSHVTSQDIDYLLDQFRSRFKQPISRQDIVALRCGIRPLAVPRDYHGDRYPLDLSRQHHVYADPGRPWVTCYGGKLTGCESMATSALELIRRRIAPTANLAQAPKEQSPPVEWTRFPGVDDLVPSVQWCVDNELCVTLEDYLRRRTNISQWVTRMGLGKHDENREAIMNIALEMARGDRLLARQLFDQYLELVKQKFDLALSE